MSKPEKFGGFTLYRIYYGDEIVYLGRTMQALQDRIRGHVFGTVMLRKIDIDAVTKIEYCMFPSQADMYLYEIYFINKYKPRLNCDDKASDDLTVKLREPVWTTFETQLWGRWKKEIHERRRVEAAAKLREKKLREEEQEMRRKRHSGEISEEEFCKWYSDKVLKTF